MKLAYLKYKDFPEKSNVDKKDCLNLVLESTEDVIQYFDWTAQNNGRKIIDAWDSIVENINRKMAPNSHLPYDPIYIVAGNLASKNMEVGEYNIFELARDYDKINNSKMQTMLKWIHEGKNVRVNHIGGTSPMSIFEIDEEIRNLNEKIIKQYLMSGNLNEDGIPDINITNDTIILENDIRISNSLRKYLKKLGLHTPTNKYYNIINSFKSKTEFLDKEGMYKLFEKIINSGVKHIIAETTLINKNQVQLLKNVITKIVENRKIEIEISILLSDASMESEAKNLISSDNKNIKINLII